MSTYNGECFLKEQLESIDKQEDVNVHCLIRDDGSTDKTLQILSEFCDAHTGFEFYPGKNIGVVKSFNELISNKIVDQYDWISFCDQDDIWLKHKLICAITSLEMVPDKSLPLLYCGNLTLVDENLHQTGIRWGKIPKFNKTTALIQNVATGCTEVFNQTAVQLYRKGMDAHMEFHDYWMFLVCIYMGKIIFDYHPQILYRQHNANVVGAKRKNVIPAIRHMIQIHGKNSKRLCMLEDFMECYRPFLSGKEISSIKHIINYKKSALSRMLLVLSPKYKGSLWKVTIGFKIRALTGNMY